MYFQSRWEWNMLTWGKFIREKYWKRLSTMIKIHTGTFPEQFCCRIMIILHCSYDLPPVSFSYSHLELVHVRHSGHPHVFWDWIDPLISIITQSPVTLNWHGCSKIPHLFQQYVLFSCSPGVFVANNGRYVTGTALLRQPKRWWTFITGWAPATSDVITNQPL